MISCGKDNDYGHPHRGVLDTFADVGAQVYDTAQEGTVVAYVDSAGALRVAAEHAGGERKAA